MHLHILGICGTFMAGVAILAHELGHKVTGQDAGAYPPMSDQLAAAGISVLEGYEPDGMEPRPDCVIVGNALSRGNAAVEYVLERRIPFLSGPAWLAQNALKDRWVLAVAGTHGKTTTSAMLALILEKATSTFPFPSHTGPTPGRPGFLIGGIPQDFGISARLGADPFFIVEADEYDTAFFDKRSKFVHYRPGTLILNNLEFDHADIFPDLAAIETQFHHLVRTVPGNGCILCPEKDEALRRVLSMGCWTPVEYFGAPPAAWQAKTHNNDGSSFTISYNAESGLLEEGMVEWDLIGWHNVQNAVAAVAAARHVGVPVADGCRVLGRFQGVKRRMEVRGRVHGVTIYDDFAHHPTAISATLSGLRARVGGQRIIAVLEPRSNTMRLGSHQGALASALGQADLLWLYEPAGIGWDMAAIVGEFGTGGHIRHLIGDIIKDIAGVVREGDHVLIMSNGGFGGIHDKLLKELADIGDTQ